MARNTFSSFKNYLSGPRNIVILSGAGISASAGIQIFEDMDSTWGFGISRHDALNAAYYNEDRDGFWEIFRFAFPLGEHEPTAFHYWAASLENMHNVKILTQNIDGLHQKAGSSIIYEMHGNLADSYEHYPNKPSIVLFGDDVKHMSKAKKALYMADLLIIAGTALKVSPVNMLPAYFASHKRSKPIAWVNPAEQPDWLQTDYQFVMGSDDFAEHMCS